jgi:hypothetical protein
VSRARTLVGVVGLAATLAACGGGAPPPPPPAAPTPTAAPAAPARPAAPVAAAPKPGAGTLLPQTPSLAETPTIKYDARGRRDPFASLETVAGPATGLTVASTRLTGIVRSPRATLALIETTDGIGYILKAGDTLGDGRLVEIGQDSVVFTVAPKPGSPASRVVLRLPGN